MAATTEPLILDLVEFVLTCPRPDAEVIEAWCTSCPRLTVWEEAVERGLVEFEHGTDGSVRVVATASGTLGVGGVCGVTAQTVARWHSTSISRPVRGRGGSVRHRSTATGQRGWNRQPGGMFAGSGMASPSPTSGMPRPGSGVSTEASRALV